MKERGMIFNGEMVRAILDGRKTQTRRIMKNQPAEVGPEAPARARNVGAGFQWYGDDGVSSVFDCPFGGVGDRIWVRETFQGPLFDFDQMDAYCKDSAPFENSQFCVYKADGKSAPEFFDADDNLRCCWRPSIHMPRWASRILLEITDVRVERLNDISECDAKAEGAPTECTLIGDKHYPGFRSLWKSIYGNDSWQASPWVWVIEFKRIQEAAQ